MVKTSNSSFETLLAKHIDNLESLLDNGLKISQEQLIRVNIEGLIADLPALAKLTNTIQFNGKHGCLKCLNQFKSHTKESIILTKNQQLRTNYDCKIDLENTKRNQVYSKGNIYNYKIN